MCSYIILLVGPARLQCVLHRRLKDELIAELQFTRELSLYHSGAERGELSLFHNGAERGHRQLLLA